MVSELGCSNLSNQPFEQEGGYDVFEILPISKAPVRQGEVDLRPVLLAPTSRGGWTIGAWNGSA